MPACGDHLCSHKRIPLDGLYGYALCNIKLHVVCGVFHSENSIKGKGEWIGGEVEVRFVLKCAVIEMVPFGNVSSPS
jgi:hypothetical protein